MMKAADLSEAMQIFESFSSRVYLWELIAAAKDDIKNDLGVIADLLSTSLYS